MVDINNSQDGFLAKHAEANKLKTPSTAYEILTPAEAKEYTNSIFEIFDTDNDGEITLEELGFNDIKDEYAKKEVKNYYESVKKRWGAGLTKEFVERTITFGCRQDATLFIRLVNAVLKGETDFAEAVEKNKAEGNFHALDTNKDGKVDNTEMGLDEAVNYIEENLPNIKDETQRAKLENKFIKEMRIFGCYTGKEESVAAARGVKPVPERLNINAHINKINNIKNEIEVLLQDKTEDS